MKRLGTLLIMLFSYQVTISQNLPCKITFKEGEAFEGFSKINKNEKILFRLDKNSEADVYGSGDIEKIEFYGQRENRTFQYVEIQATTKKTKHLLMEIIENGKIQLFQHYRTKRRFNQTSPSFNYNEGLPRITGEWETEYIVKKYLKPSHVDLAISLNEPDNVADVLTKHMFDCPSVLDELRVIEGVNYIEDLVWQYNRDCGGDEN